MKYMLIVLSLVFCLPTAYGQASVKNKKPQPGMSNPYGLPNSIEIAPGVYQSVPVWITEDWTADETPYHNARLEIDNLVAKKQLTATTVSDYKDQYKSSENGPEGHPDPILAFRWIYAVYKARYAYVSLPGMLLPSGKDLTGDPSPHSYELDRLLFIYKLRIGNPHLGYRRLGIRLLARNPKDTDVEYAMVNVLLSSETSSDAKLAMSYVKSLIAQDPKCARNWTKLGEIYYYQWIPHTDITAGRHAIAAYQKFLLLSDKKDPFRLIVVKTINSIKAETPGLRKT